jgi:hypothetical protein
MNFLIVFLAGILGWGLNQKLQKITQFTLGALLSFLQTPSLNAAIKMISFSRTIEVFYYAAVGGFASLMVRYFVEFLVKKTK